jgi:hypothetical protein
MKNFSQDFAQQAKEGAAVRAKARPEDYDPADNFERVINPGTVEEYTRAGRHERVPVYVKIKYEGGRLSMTGVVGPRANGDAWGSCGQIIDTLAREDFLPTAGGFWLANTKTLRETWERWHLNDMRAECSHQRAAGWIEQAGRKVKLYHWRLDDAGAKEQKAAQEAARKALEGNYTFTPTAAEHRAAIRPYERTTTTPDAPEHYGPRTSLYSGMAGPVEEKALGWLRPEEHPLGLMCRPCPECGYEYGSAWNREEVPPGVLEWLCGLPEAKPAPAWC